MISKYVLPFVVGLMSVFSVGSIFGNTGSTHKETPTQSVRMLKEAVRDFSSEQDVPEGKLSISTTSSTLTSMGQSFSFTFSTGGQGWQDTTKTFLLAPDDADFDAYYDEFSKLTVEDREKITEQYENGEYEPPEFNSYVFKIAGTSANKRVYIPRALTRNHIFNLTVSRMDLNVVPDWTNIQSIAIPVEITEIYSETFQNVPADMVFNVEAPSKPEGWADDWAHGATVNYGYEYPEEKEMPLSTAGAEQFGDKTQNFIIGWYPKEGEQKPLTLEYKLLKDGVLQDDVHYFDFSPSSDKSTYECVGFQLIDYSNVLYCDIPLSAGEEVDFSSLMIHNIYRSKTSGSGDSTVYYAEPDLADAYHLKPKQAFSKTYNVTDFINLEFTGLSTFSGYTSIDLKVDISEENVYSHLKSNYYNTHLADIQSGKVHIRYRLTSLGLCKFRITYTQNGSEVTEDVKIVTPIQQFIIQKQKDNHISFLLKNKGYAAENIKEVSLVGLYISVDLMGSRSVIARSSSVTRFGYMSIMPYTEKASVFNVNTMLIIIAIAYIVAYAVGAVALYFFLKNKYKNDEFRRMKTKSYVLKASLGLAGSLIVIFAIIFIVVRNTVLNNAIVVFNPVDAYIIVLSVLSVLIIGYFIKYLVGVIKTEKERRRILKLKLNEDVEDDGTN